MTYASLIMSHSPLAYWRLGESSGTTAVDETGTVNGTYGGSPNLGVPGLLPLDADTAVQFDGSQYVEMATGSQFGMVSEYTLCAWIRADDWNNPFIGDRIVHIGQAYLDVVPIDNPPTRFDMRSGAQVGFQGIGAVAEDVDVIGNTLFVVGVRRGTLHYLYLNGQLAGASTQSVAGNVDLGWDQSGNIPGGSIGARQFISDQFFSGVIDEVAVFDYALSSADIAELYAEAIPNTAPTITGPPGVDYNGLTRLGPQNTPGTITFTADDADDDPLTYTIRTGANGAGTLVADGNSNTGTPTNVNLAHNASGMTEGTNTLYLRVSDGTEWSADSSFTVLVDRTAPTVGTITVTPDVVTGGN